MQEVPMSHLLQQTQEQADGLNPLSDEVRFFCGGTWVRLTFSPDGRPLEELLKEYFIALKSGGAYD